MLDCHIILSCCQNLKAIIDNIKLTCITNSLQCLSHQWAQSKEIKEFVIKQ